jgi:hypothetical protein|tara:strand:- start:144 stop:284 length:141 start_codon:yes stop_codon:yes gene_type:complete
METSVEKLFQYIGKLYVEKKLLDEALMEIKTKLIEAKEKYENRENK